MNDKLKVIDTRGQAKEQPKKVEKPEKPEVSFSISIVMSVTGELGFRAEMAGKEAPDNGVPQPVVRDTLQRVLHVIEDQMTQGMVVAAVSELVKQGQLSKPGFRPGFLGKLFNK